MFFLFKPTILCLLSSFASRAILKNPDLLPETPIWNLFYNDFWGTPLLHSGSHKSYRPLCVLTFRLNYLLGGLDPWGYHLGNVICHTITTALFTVLARLLLVSQIGTFAAGLLFAAHPIHTEAVAGIVGRADILACAYFLLTLMCYMKYVEVRSSKTPSSRWLLSGLVLVLTAAGMLNKEQALTVLAVCASYDVFVAHRISLSDIFTFRIFTQVVNFIHFSCFSISCLPLSSYYLFLNFCSVYFFIHLNPTTPPHLISFYLIISYSSFLPPFNLMCRCDF